MIARCVLNGARAMFRLVWPKGGALGPAAPERLPLLVLVDGAWREFDLCEACYFALRVLRESKGLGYALTVLDARTWSRSAAERFVASRPYRALRGNSAAPGMATRGRASLGTAEAPPDGTAKATRGHRQPSAAEPGGPHSPRRASWQARADHHPTRRRT